MTTADSEVLEFVRKERRRSLLKNLSLLRDENCLTDVTLIVGDRVFPAHRLLLAANSQYFKEIFKKKPHVKKITIGDVDTEVFTTVLNYLYTGRLIGPASLDRLKIKELIFALKSLKVVNYNKVGGEVVLNTLSVDSFYQLWLVAKSMKLKAAEQEISRYVAKNLESCCQINDFLLLTLQQLISVMASTNLSKLTPEVVLGAVLAWAGSEPAKRRKYIPSILSVVGLRSYFDESDDLIVSESPHRDTYDAIPTKCKSSATEYKILLQKTECSKSADASTGSSEATSATTSNISITSQPTSSMSAESVQKVNVDHLQRQIKASENESQLNCCIDAKFGDCLHASELNRDDFSPSLQQISVDKKNKLDTIPSREPMESGFLPTDFSCIMCIGQDDVSLPVQSFYNYKSKHWMPLQVTIRVIGDNVTTVLHKRSLFYLGGELPGHEPLNSAYVHTLDSLTLKQIASMSVARFSAGAVCCADQIYVVGGLTNHSDLLDGVERYDPEYNTWETLPNLLFARCNPSVAATELGIYVASGFLDNYNFQVCFSCEFFSLATGEWTEIASMPTGICALPTAITTIEDEIYLIRLMKPNKIYLYDKIADTWRMVCHCNNAGIQIVALLNVEGWLWVVDEKQRMYKFNFESEEWETVTKMPSALYPPMHVFVLEKAE